MRSILLVLLLLSACGAPAPEDQKNVTADVPVPSGPPIVQQVEGDVPNRAVDTGPRWESATGESGTGLRFIGEGGAVEMSIACPEARTRLVVGVPSFKPIGTYPAPPEALLKSLAKGCGA
jgi:hypothetical protein